MPFKKKPLTYPEKKAPNADTPLEVGDKGNEINYNFVLIQQIAYITRANMVGDDVAYIRGVNHLAALLNPYVVRSAPYLERLKALDQTFKEAISTRLDDRQIGRLKRAYADKKFTLLINVMSFKNFLPDEGVVEYL